MKQQRWQEVLAAKTRDAALGRAIKRWKKVSLRKGPGEQQKNEQTSRSAGSSMNPCAHCVQEG